MTAADFKSSFQQLIAQAKLEEAFNWIDTHVSKSSDIWQDEILAVQSQFSELEREFNVGIIERNEYRTVRNGIQYRLNNIVKKLDDVDIVEPIEDKNAILIICRNDTDEFYMRDFCSQKKELNYEVKQLKAYEDPTNYRFIIFDNHSIKDIDDRFQLKEDEIPHLNLMKEYIEEYREHKKYMIHFGNEATIVRTNRDIVYSANSKFSLYSRILEMEQYIQDSRVIK